MDKKFLVDPKEINLDPFNQRRSLTDPEVRELAHKISSQAPEVELRDGVVLNGHMRLKVGLEPGNKVAVRELSTGETFFVEAGKDGKIVRVEDSENPGQSNLKTRRPGPR